MKGICVLDRKQRKENGAGGFEILKEFSDSVLCLLIGNKECIGEVGWDFGL